MRRLLRIALIKLQIMRVNRRIQSILHPVDSLIRNPLAPSEMPQSKRDEFARQFCLAVLDIVRLKAELKRLKEQKS